jgi:hypothetical protein
LRDTTLIVAVLVPSIYIYTYEREGEKERSKRNNKKGEIKVVAEGSQW